MKKSESISVVMTTYNGEKYLTEQLDSIRNQTVAPSEVIICDDCSTDGTWEILVKYKAKYKLDCWHIFQNKKNIGWKINFYNALNRSTGDIIFLADQDDVWVECKIERCFAVMKNNTDIELLTTNYDYLVNGKVKKSRHKTKLITKCAFDERFFHNQKPGAVYAFRRILLDETLPYWDKNMPHDSQLWLIALARGTSYVYNRSLILYRRHENTATGRESFGIETKLYNVLSESKLVKMCILYCEANNNILTGRNKKNC